MSYLVDNRSNWKKNIPVMLIDGMINIICIHMMEYATAHV